jgi:hypothetical protein
VIDRAHRLELDADLDPAVAAVAQGDTVSATPHLARLDAALAAQAATTGSGMQTLLRARGGILVISETLAVHAAYFGSGTHG